MHLLNRRAVRVTLLVALVVVGGALRFTDINWDRFQHVHPDERFIVWVADTMHWPDEVAGGFFSQLAVALDPARSALNPLRWPPAAAEMAGQPRNFAYGHFPLYLLVAVGHAAAAVGRWFGETTLAFPAWMQPLHTVGRQLAGYSHLTLVGRAISALADLGTLLLIYAMATRVARHVLPRAARHARSQESQEYSLVYAAGFLAAAAYAFAVLPIQLSHYAAVDALLTFFIVATSARAADGRVAWDSGACGHARPAAACRCLLRVAAPVGRCIAIRPQVLVAGSEHDPPRGSGRAGRIAHLRGDESLCSA